MVKIGDQAVSPVSFGCMSLSHAYGPFPDDKQAGAVLNAALDNGYTMLDTAALYGLGHNESLIGKHIAHRREEYFLASKCVLMRGADGKAVTDGRPAAIKQSCEESLQRLQTDVIDLLYVHRPDHDVPIEESVGALADLVQQGKIRNIGLSEMSADMLRRAHAVHPIAAMQSEYSLWTRNPEIAVLDACRELGTAFVAFGSLARAFLTGKLNDPEQQLIETDIRRFIPRFSADNYPQNLRLLEPFAEIASEQNCTMAQLALAWVLAQGEHVVSIPGTKSIDYLIENKGAESVSLDAQVVQRLDQLINRETVVGLRYNEPMQATVTTERFSAA